MFRVNEEKKILVVDARTGASWWCAFDVERNPKGHVKGYRVRLRESGDGIADFDRRGIGKGEALRWLRLVPEVWSAEQAANDLRAEYSASGLQPLSPHLPNRIRRKNPIASDPKQGKLF